MRKFNSISALVCVISLSIFFVVTSCVGVDICMEPDHPHTSQIDIIYRWNDNLEHPEKTLVFANRPYLTCRYALGWFTEYNEGCEIAFLSPDTLTDKKSYYDISLFDWFSEEATVEDADTFRVRLGSYQFMTINSSPYLTLDSLDAYMTQSETSVEVLGVKYKTWATPVAVDSCFKDWFDFNPEYRYTRDFGPVYCAEQTAIVEKSKNTEIIFEPHTITQRINFLFTIESEAEGIVIDSIKGEISGVVPYRNIYSSHIKLIGEETCRMLFNAEDKGLGIGIIHDCMATIDVLGLMAPASANMQTGPGILHLAAYTHIITDEGTEERRTILWGINLFDVLKEHPVTVSSKDKAHYTISSPEETLNIPYPLKIHISDFNLNNGDIEHWQTEDGNGTFDIEY